MEPTAACAPLPLGFVDQTPWRDEVIRPLVLFADRTAQQRAQETHPHPDTVRTLQRRFRREGLWGLLPVDVEGSHRRRASPIPEAVRQAIDRLQALDDGCHSRELARLLFITVGTPIDHKTVKTRWQARPVACQGHLARWDYHTQPDRYQARLQVIQRYSRGWEKIRLSRFLHRSRPTVDAWIQRVERAHVAGLVDRSRAPHAPVRTMWLPLMGQVYHLQKAHPEAGEFRMGSLLARSEVSVRTIGRGMALNKLLSDAIPHGPKRGMHQAPGPHPYKALPRHQYWVIDGRRMDVAVDGVRWWRLMILDGSSRPMLAGAMAPSEATWAALMGRYTACRRYGAPGPLVSESGGAYTSHDFEAVCTRRQVPHETIVRTQGESDLNGMETPCNIQRRLSDDQCSLARTPAELEQRHQAFIRTDNTTAHQGLLRDQRLPPMPVEVLGTATGRVDAEDELARCCSQALFPRLTTRYGGVTLHRDHCSVEAGIPKTPVLLWVAGEQLRAVFEHVILAESHGRYDRQDRKVNDIREGLWYQPRLASPQGALIPLTPQACLVVYRAKRPRRQAPHPARAQQWLLFEFIATG